MATVGAILRQMTDETRGQILVPMDDRLLQMNHPVVARSAVSGAPCADSLARPGPAPS
jgi:hypothetical protein